MKARALGSHERAHRTLVCDVDVSGMIVTSTATSDETSEAGLPDIWDRQAKLAASLNRRKP